MPSPTENLRHLLDTLKIKEGIPEDVKRQAMELVEQGADPGVKGHSQQDTLLHLLVLTNKKACHTPEITSILTSKQGKDLLETQGFSGYTPLVALIYYFNNQLCTFEDFKETAMLLARNKAPLKVSHLDVSLLHILVLNNKLEINNNKAGINNSEILELLQLDPGLINYSQHNTPLAFLIDHAVNHHCTLEEFKATALLLAKNEALDIKKKGRLTGMGLLEYLLLTNQNGMNAQEIEEIIAGHPDVLINNPLQTLIVQYAEGLLGLDIFKTSVLLLARHDVDLTVTVGTNKTVLQILAASNQGGINNQEILTLLNCKPELIKQPTSQTVFEQMLKSWDECPMGPASESFKIPAVLLSQGSDVHLKIAGKTLLDRLIAGNKEGQNNKEIAALLKSNKEKYIQPLIDSIEKMRQYGLALLHEGHYKGSIAVTHAIQLNLLVEQLLSEEDNVLGFSDFQKFFPDLLKNEKIRNQMGTYRFAWDTVIANVLIALSGIGLFFIAGHLLYTYATEGRPLFFLQKSKTTCEEHLETIEQKATPLLQI